MIPYGKRHSVAVRWSSISSYTLPLHFTCSYLHETSDVYRIYRSMLAEDYSLSGFAPMSAHSELKSVASRLMQYCWTHWDDPVDVSVTRTAVNNYEVAPPVE